jgi:hypothetical protein
MTTEPDETVSTPSVTIRVKGPAPFVPLVEEMRAFGEWAKVEREAHGFVWLGTCEADPRMPGPPTLVWGRDYKDDLHVAVWPEAPPYTLAWEQITDAEWAERYPHAMAPSRLPADYDPTRDENRTNSDLASALLGLAGSPLNTAVRRRIREILDVLDERGDA